ncbi:hypothetical protein [Acinetobacter proteolyticus]|uniref:Uncharacterized protein n=1 Tax=Acinetobacter proteolyticus TaxID=1776741 RepID=A0A2N0WII3_9GAMM|nr:hypothetical protein [Acinetobacter proteolyticus]PKF35576.1 hypothetical protein CW311_04615 [Acinetobacter proteolyticus]
MSGMSISTTRPSRKNEDAVVDKKKQQQLENLLDKGPTTRTSIVFTKDQHRRYKIYLAQNGKKMNDDIMEYVESCIKDIP